MTQETATLISYLVVALMGGCIVATLATIWGYRIGHKAGHKAGYTKGSNDTRRESLRLRVIQEQFLEDFNREQIESFIQNQAEQRRSQP